MRLAEEVTPSDVAEAIRLMKEAWHSSAIDPTTGHLDMSMINTGISETDREIQRMLPSELQKLLEGMDERTGTIRELRDKLSLQNISCNSQQIVNALSGIGSVAVSGGTWRRR